MPQSTPEPKKPGRPRLSESDAKGKLVPVRFKSDDFQKIAEAAKKKNVTVSEWIRSTLATAVGE
jgi:predicted HicB family RNase H-like nuclease